MNHGEKWRPFILAEIWILHVICVALRVANKTYTTTLGVHSVLLFCLNQGIMSLIVYN